MEKELKIKGGEFLVKQIEANDVFIPEEFDEEQKMIAQTCEDFLETEVFPNLEQIDAQEDGVMRTALEKAGELGLLGISVPEEYEGFGQNIITSMLSADRLGAGYSFAVAFSAHTGIGSLPIVYYGNHEQKQKYLPKLASGELMAAYCLTEPGAGSDANSGTTKAVLSEDGKHYILNGQKMWITNGGFADVQTVFAKIDNDRVYSAFIVEREWDGVSLNPEEKKMGIKGSSTRQIFYNDVKVPVENLLGKRGEGFRIALNILHMGRLKLGANVIGSCKRAISQSVNYSNERKQFGTLISSFGSIKHKLAEQAIKAFTNESAVYRASNDVDILAEINKAEGKEYGKANMDAYAEFAPEAAIMKVYGSEALDYIVDEAVQVMGGMGFSAEMPADRAYRDSRINRIFEGTNEINRILVTDTIIKRGQKGNIKLFEKAKEILAGLDNLCESCCCEGGDYFENKTKYISNFKNVALMLMEAAVNKFQRKLVHEQEVLNSIADIVMNTYVAESTMLRIQKLETMRGEELNLHRDMLDVYVFESASLIYKHGMDAIYSIDDQELTEKLIKGLKIYTKTSGVNTKDARRRIADKLIEENKYCF
ncbi:MAG: acyl-CoA dehydrogenase family protein [Bacteroidales bacterium]|nr:acyl-CoA dehydrogenase family protein [Bacteroidales bacterium]